VGPEIDEVALAAKFAVMRPFLSERGWRVYLGTEANALGYGGIAAVARAAGVSETTVAAGAAQAADREGLAALEPGRSRRPGAGRPRAEDTPGLKQALDGLLEQGKRGDPMSAVTWNILSLRDIAGQMGLLGFEVSRDTVARLMHGDGYSLQGMSRVLEGKQHPDRDAQFGRINAKIAQYQAAGQPVISADGKKKERLGAYHRAGKSWRGKGDPVPARSHDFPDSDTVTITPYGIYDIAANRGFVVAGTSHDTAAFAVHAIGLWWQHEGQSRYPQATRLLVTCDAGGSNNARCRLWKDQLAVLAEQAGLVIEVCHFPPGTSKWNKIEHRLFCHITRTWRARPLMTREDAVAGIAATTTSQGLKCTAVLDDAVYPAGIQVSDERMACLEQRILDRDDMHGEWNYTLLPVPRPAPAPAPGPGPGPGPAGPDPALLDGLAALAGIPALDTLLQAIAVPFAAAREQRLHLARGKPRTKTSGPASSLSLAAIVTAAACHLHLRMPYELLSSLLGAHPSTISLAVRRITPLLAEHGITRAARPARIITTTQDLREHAAAARITLAIPAASHDTPETTN
jgi:hypothetical protein